MDARVEKTNAASFRQNAVLTAVRRLAGGLSRTFRLTPINRRRWEKFKANRRGYWSSSDLPRPVRPDAVR